MTRKKIAFTVATGLFAPRDPARRLHESDAATDGRGDDDEARTATSHSDARRHLEALGGRCYHHPSPVRGGSESGPMQASSSILRERRIFTAPLGIGTASPPRSRWPVCSSLRTCCEPPPGS